MGTVSGADGLLGSGGETLREAPWPEMLMGGRPPSSRRSGGSREGRAWGAERAGRRLRVGAAGCVLCCCSSGGEGRPVVPPPIELVGSHSVP